MNGGVFNLQQLLSTYLTHDNLIMAVRIILFIAIGFPLAKLLSKITGRLVQNKASLQVEILLRRFIYYTCVLLIIISVMNEMGFKLSALLGAAGVLGIAIGFASQTSVSNIISGLFLISEKPFTIGDIIQIGDTVGYVISIDLLSVKVRTFDYRFVRIPNENMIKAEITNLTRFESRRVNLQLSVPYTADLPRVNSILEAVAAKEPLALKEPQPTIQFDCFGESGIGIMFGVWGRNEDYVLLRTNLIIQIMESFRAAGIDIPYQHIVVMEGERPSPPVASAPDKG